MTQRISASYDSFELFAVEIRDRRSDESTQPKLDAQLACGHSVFKIKVYESACPVHSSVKKSEVSVLIELPIKFARKFEGSATRDAHEREQCENGGRESFLSFCFLVSLRDEN